jgi:hypothetical protein
MRTPTTQYERRVLYERWDRGGHADRRHRGVLLEDKASRVREPQAKGKKVARENWPDFVFALQNDICRR